MKKSRRFLVGGFIILGALAYIIYGGMQEALVYFVTPSELKANETASSKRFLRLGGMVVKGSLQKDLQNLTYRFELTDGTASIPVLFRGIPPDLFTEGKGAVVEGRVTDGVFHATTIMAKHAEEYSPHVDANEAGYRKSFVPARDPAKP